MDSRPSKTIPKSRSNTRISVLTGTTASKLKSSVNSSESTRLVKHHGAAQGGSAAGGGGANSVAGGSGYRNIRTQARSAAAGGGDGGRSGGYGTGYQTLAQSQQAQGIYKNPVDACLYVGVAGFGWCMVAWLIGLALLALQYARTWSPTVAHQQQQQDGAGQSQSQARYHNGPDEPSWLVFAPFWLGDLLALVVLAQVLAKVASVRFATPNRNRGGMRRPSGGDIRERSTGSLSDLAGNGNGNCGNVVIPVNLDYFPLIQRVVVTAVVSFVILVLIVVEQVLVCLWWGGTQREQRGEAAAGGGGVPGPFVLATPLLILEGLCLLRVVMLRTKGVLSGLTWGLLFLLTLSAALRWEDSIHDAPVLRHYPWLECLTPLWALDILYFGVAGYVAANTCAGRFVMAPTQGLCFGLFVVALIGSTVAELLLTGDQRLTAFHDQIPQEVYVRWDLQLLLGILSLAAFCLAVFLSAEYSVSRLVSTHGYDDPLPLCETPNGWEWSGAGKTRWGLLGAVSVRAEKKVALPGGLSGSKGMAVSSMNMGPTDDPYAYKAYQRTDSGQYVDIYDKL